MTATTPFYLDCDTGIDDALALTYLLNTASVELVGIGTVFGNTSAARAAQNTAALLTAAGADKIPVAVGAATPLLGPYPGGAPLVHGDNGIGDVILPAGPAPVAESAPEMIVRLAYEYPHELEIVAIGPLTNIARALEIEPDVARLVRTLTIMGGAVWAPGNVTEHAEANIANDPEAAQMVFNAGFRTVLVPLDVTMQHQFDDSDAVLLHETDSTLHIALGTMLNSYIGAYEGFDGYRRAPLHDPLAAAIATGDLRGRSRATRLNVTLHGTRRGKTTAVEGDANSISVVTSTVPTAAERIRGTIMLSASKASS